MSRIIDRRFLVPVAAFAGTYLLYVASVLGVRAAELPPWWAAVLPVVPLVLLVGVFVLAWDRLDEVERAMHHLALGVGFVAAMLSGILLSRLEAYGLIEAGARFVWTAGLVGWMVGLFLGRIRFR